MENLTPGLTPIAAEKYEKIQQNAYPRTIKKLVRRLIKLNDERYTMKVKTYFDTKCTQH